MMQLGRWLSRWLAQEHRSATVSPPPDTAQLGAALRAGDVLLVEGTSRIATAIKYLTQSTWSHSALYIGRATADAGRVPADHCFVEADIVHGVRSVALEQFAGRHVRICRPAGLRAEDATTIVEFVLARLGHHYDLRNVFDLARYLLPIPPVPTRFRRRMLALGSGDPTRAICSTLIAEAFQSVQFPILPDIRRIAVDEPEGRRMVEEITHVRHHSLFAPRDFDVSPYFQIIKPTLDAGFDYRALRWPSAAPESET